MKTLIDHLAQYATCQRDPRGLFSVGWVIQFVAHYYNKGRKPASVGDVVSLVVGPLVVVAELGFLLGLCKEVEKAFEDRSGGSTFEYGRA